MPGTINLPLIKKLRINKGFTYSDMAKALGLKEAEKGKYRFQAIELPPLARKLGIPIEKIFK